MVRSFAALSVFAFLGASVLALPVVAPTAEAREAPAMAKGDRLVVRSAALNCSTQVWPEFAASCLRNKDSGVKIVQARLVTVRR